MHSIVRGTGSSVLFFSLVLFCGPFGDTEDRMLGVALLSEQKLKHAASMHLALLSLPRNSSYVPSLSPPYFFVRASIDKRLLFLGRGRLH